MLFDVGTDNIDLHIANILAEGELDNSTTEKSSVVQTEGKRQVKRVNKIINSKELNKSTCSFLEQVQNEGGRIVRRKIKIHNLDMIISVGYRVNSKRDIAFRKWKS